MRHEGLSQMSHHATWSVATAFADRQGAQRVPRASVAERSAHHRSSQLVALGPRRGIRLYELEELHVVVDHLLERRGAVVVKVRRGLSDAPKSGDVELLPVVQGGRAADESGQHGASRIGARPANLRPGGEQPCRARRRHRQRDLIGSCVPGQARSARRKHESRGSRGVDGTWALAHDAMESNHWPRRHV